MSNTFNLLELAVIHTALQERCERLQEIYSQDNSDIKLYGEIKSSQSALEKVKELKEIKEEFGYDFEIEIDGGINLNNVKTVTENETTSRYGNLLDAYMN